ncbi:MAG TPA: DUF1697 domain-containing protein, partial [Acidimicrobiales bacterium]
MTTYFGFLRAVNVGKRRVVMADLRTELADLGFDDVATFINSGNVIFRSSARAATVERQIEERLHEWLGFEVETFVRTASELRAVLAHQPFDGFEPGNGPTVQVGFGRGKLSSTAAAAVEGLSTDYDHLHVHGRDVYWWTAGTTQDTLVRSA